MESKRDFLCPLIKCQLVNLNSFLHKFHPEFNSKGESLMCVCACVRAYLDAFCLFAYQLPLIFNTVMPRCCLKQPDTQLTASCLFLLQMMKFAWDNYKLYALGKNELRPLTRNGHIGNMFGELNIAEMNTMAGLFPKCLATGNQTRIHILRTDLSAWWTHTPLLQNRYINKRQLVSS